MSKTLAVLLELKECSEYWSEYNVPIGVHERIEEAIAELLAQPEAVALTSKQIRALYRASRAKYVKSYEYGFKDAEKYYGITDDVDTYRAKVGVDE